MFQTNNNIAPTANINNIGGGVKYLVEGATLFLHMERIFGIYKITNPIGRVYIGQSINIEKRKWCYSKYQNCKPQTLLYRSLLKYRWEAHRFEILQQCEPNQLNPLEVYYSELYQSCNPKYGLNIRQCGGSKGKLSDETRKKISFKLTGRERSEGHSNKIRESHIIATYKGKHTNKGRILSEEHKEKIRNSLQGKKYKKYT